ncbi:TPR repeat [Streptomyces sp. 2231.1]|uniref:hypothetical protein n=1 Tax=Streptomyces sp. 2231.1 TaxID=1855347 RepID=UPI000899B2E2|nr:hypothetical protein [Streptomyces sp. 2231.1]SEC05003.1 TPR repeat [Streptomyces sp. 2231.1]
MQDERDGNPDNPALSELRRKLNYGLARSRIDSRYLPARSELGRTTVWGALKDGAPVPSAKTVAKLAGALGLPVTELLALQRDAAGGGGGKQPVPGRPIREWEPHTLEVHPAGAGSGIAAGSCAPLTGALPTYVERGHDLVLADAVRDVMAGRSRMVVLVGHSSTGKTRACWEAVEPLAGRGWRLWHPFDPTRAEAALEGLHRVAPRTVAWLNEAQHYLGGREAGERVAAAPELLNRYERATPAAKAVLEAAMDARRLGAGLHLPQAFLTDAAPDYLTDTDYDQLPTDWAEQAYAELVRPVHGKQAPLHSTTPRPRRRPPTPSSPVGTPPPAVTGPMFRLADYLEQHGRSTRRSLCPPASFWHAALTHPTKPDDLNNLAEAAESRYRMQWAHHLRHRAADHGCIEALLPLAVMREKAGDQKGAESLAQQAAAHGQTDALLSLARMRGEARDLREAENLYREAADHGDYEAMSSLAEMYEWVEDWETADNFHQEAAAHGDREALSNLTIMREEAGDHHGAEDLARQLADQGKTDALTSLAQKRMWAGDRESAENLYRDATAHGDTGALEHLAIMREEAGDRDGAETFAQQAADRNSGYALFQLAQMREKAGDRGSAENLYKKAADQGDTKTLSSLAVMREEAGDRDGAENLARQAADRDNCYALFRLAEMREKAGDRDGAENLARQAADRGGSRWSLDELTQGIATAWWPNGLDPDGTPTPPWP